MDVICTSAGYETALQPDHFHILQSKLQLSKSQAQAYIKHSNATVSQMINKTVSELLYDLLNNRTFTQNIRTGNKMWSSSHISG